MHAEVEAVQFFRSLMSIWMWADIALVSILGFFIQALVWLVALPFDRRRYASGRFYRLMAVTASKLNPMWDFNIAGPLPAYRPTKTVVVSNHESQADPFLVSHLPWEMKWMGKSSLFKIPFVGWSMWLAGDIPLTRGQRDSAKSAMGIAAGWLKKDMPVMIFPEGTRSSDSTLLPFKDGAFRLAIDEQADVLPVALMGTHRALPKHSWKAEFTRAWVKVGEPISTAGMTLADVDRLKQMARQQIETMREDISKLMAAAPAPGSAER
jgi:1-acyl-sn-glycerol-3-phosphate acyltransferase